MSLQATRGIELDVTKCTGCKACLYACRQGAIYFETADDGYIYPKINNGDCVKCGQCIKACPSQNQYIGSNVKSTYASRCNSEAIVKNSSSGGVFTVLAKKIIESNGAVYGVGIDTTARVCYKRITTIESIAELRGSKYVQSDIDIEIIDEFIQDICSGRIVLFVGTPCQVAGIKAICKLRKIDDSKLYTVDLLCAGGTSPKIWGDYVKHLGLQGKEYNLATFRDKKKGWRDSCVAVGTEEEKKEELLACSQIGKFFFMDETKREACIKCKYRSMERVGDISLGDWWNEIYCPAKWRDNKGISKVFVNSAKGKALFDNTNEEIESIPMELGKANCNVTESSKLSDVSDARERFWNEYLNNGYDHMVDKYCRVSIKDIILWRVVRPILIKTRLIGLVSYMITR